MSQYPYEQQPSANPQPYDQPPTGYAQPQYQTPPQQSGYQQPQGYYAPPAYYPPPAPVQVNVVQNAGYPLAVRERRVNHALHITLTFFTGGLWLFIYIPLLLRRSRQIVVYR